jgi:hypothetical protein
MRSLPRSVGPVSVSQDGIRSRNAMPVQKVFNLLLAGHQNHIRESNVYMDAHWVPQAAATHAQIYERILSQTLSTHITDMHSCTHAHT